ncbi:hypothetical protein [Ructibacterium gallinarum]|uniref:Dockerin domain-containing protein n=1 Tax=Ructibacterium gallinarum TaxID=2779355 RepID=A0A9D5M231_9FIRM|nr:hypothetical protein [Ructibacterium gallinarum]MBE5040028.1 hypothetical protein [Ructibacterium gallinarum]
MKEYKKFKKFGAAMTAVAMLGLMGTGAFAAEEEKTEVPEVPAVEVPAEEVTEAPVVDETEVPAEEVPVVDETETPAEEAPVVDETEAPAEEIPVVDETEVPAEEAPVVDETEAPAEEVPAEEANANVDLLAEGDGNVMQGEDMVDGTGIAITAATATVDDAGVYTVKMTYTIDGAEATNQVTMLAYLFEGDGSAWTAEDNIETGSIRAIDQDANSTYNGTISFKLAKNGSLTVNPDSTLVVKMGSDAATATAAQAVIIDLANASAGEPEPSGKIGDVNNDGVINGTDANAAVMIWKQTFDFSSIEGLTPDEIRERADLADPKGTINGSDANEIVILWKSN